MIDLSTVSCYYIYMEIIGNEIKITGLDYPVTIFEALHAGAKWGADNLPDQQAQHWGKTAADAWGRIRGRFGIVNWGDHNEVLKPEGEAEVYLGLPQLELSLVVHGLAQIAKVESGDNTAKQEVANVNAALRSIDHALGRR